MKLTFRTILTAIILVALIAFGLSNVAAQFGPALAAGVFLLVLSLNTAPITHQLGTATTVERNTDNREAQFVYLPVAAATKIPAGALVARDSAGRAVNAADTAGLKVIGRAEETVDNTAGSAGDLSINIKLGCFLYANSGTVAVDADDVGKLCFVEDNQTIGETSTNFIVAGRVVAVETAGVWVDTRYAYFGISALPALTVGAAIVDITGGQSPTEAEFIEATTRINSLRADLIALRANLLG